MRALAILSCAVTVSMLPAALEPSVTGAFARVTAAPTAGPAGLPDGRVYEEVSPANKHGNAAALPVGLQPPAMLAEPQGNGVAYNVNGTAIGDTQSGVQTFTVAKHVGQGWVNHGATPRSIGEQSVLQNYPEKIGFSADLTKVLFGSQADYLTETSAEPTPFDAALMYDLSTGSLTWLDYTRTEGLEGHLEGQSQIAGFSSDMSTFYLKTPSGIYEWHDGTLSPTGVLPDGSIDPSALFAGFPQPSGGGFAKYETRNQVSADGTRAFFVSSQGGSGAPELYVRERAGDGTESTVLVSRDTLLAPVNGLPAPASHGVVEISFPIETVQGEALSGEGESRPGFAYASPDGARVFFASEDPLTSDAPVGGGIYEFNTLTDALTYLPGVGVSPVLVSSQDGSRFLFNSSGGLSLWSEGSGGGGEVTPIEPFPANGEARSTPDGSAFVFESAALISGFNNGGSHRNSKGAGPFRNQEIYRYDVAEGSLSCVSCPPAGIVPGGNAYFSHDVASQTTATDGVFMQGAGISQDGDRVFFDTPDPLVPQDTNTAPLQPSEEGEIESGRDVYEWEGGRVFLISSGTSSRDSYVGDQSADGNDVFFSTAQGIAPGDTDEGYDVYDARVPRPGDRLAPAAAACAGDVCQGPPSVYTLLSAPSSETFDGRGNTPATAPKPIVTPKSKKAAKRCKKGFSVKHGKCARTRPKHKNRSKKGKK